LGVPYFQRKTISKIHVDERIDMSVSIGWVVARDFVFSLFGFDGTANLSN
jgi:hypothetical protein